MEAAAALTDLDGRTAAMVDSLTLAERGALSVRMGVNLEDRSERVKAWAKRRVEMLRRAHEQAIHLPSSDRLRVARELSGLSRSQAGKLLQMTPSAIATMEAGETPATAEALDAFADIYDVPREWLTGSAAPEWLQLLLMFRFEHDETKRELA